jgi:hypothetical protein
MKKGVIGLIIVFLIILSTFFSITSTAETKDIKNTVQIHPQKRYTVNIETTGGEINYTWKIVNIANNITVDFTISKDDVLIISPKPLVQKSETREEEAGVYTFEWLNSNNFSLNISYRIKFEKEKKEESTGCYSTSILSLMLLSGMIAIVFNKKK